MVYRALIAFTNPCVVFRNVAGLPTNKLPSSVQCPPMKRTLLKRPSRSSLEGRSGISVPSTTGRYLHVDGLPFTAATIAESGAERRQESVSAAVEREQLVVAVTLA